MGAKILKGRVIKGVASRFSVDTADGVKFAVGRKKLKAAGEIYVGDYVELAEERGTYVIENVLPRRNSLIRPYVANVDVCLIVIAPVPEPDFVLVDKVIVNCLYEGIKPVLVANKTDISRLSDLADYKNVVEIFQCSATEGEGTDNLTAALHGKTVCLAGQSAVGKSSLVNSILKSDLLETSELAKKIQRGRHTTRQTELLKVGDFFIIDTCGFSMLETIDLKPEELRLYFDEFEEPALRCKFKSCTHINEPDCAVKAEVGKNISEGRYNRYKTIFSELTERKNEKYQ